MKTVRSLTSGDMPPLLDDDIHLWKLSLNESPAPLTHLLSGDERQRAESFKLAIHRTRFINRRALMRQSLGRYTGQSPEKLHFLTNPHGKPFLCDGPSFNLSHSDDIALLAVRAAGALGVDVERIRPMDNDNLSDVARMHFNEAELRDWSSADDSLLAFFDIWTGKEAILKAMGTGLSVPAQSVSAEEWAIQRVDFDGYRAAVVWC